MKCKHIKTDGTACNASAMKSSSFCFTHNPKTRELHLEATVKGGQAAHSKALELLPPVKNFDPKEILAILFDTINRVRRIEKDGSMDVRTANCIGFLSSKILEAHKAINLEERVADLENRWAVKQ